LSKVLDWSPRVGRCAQVPVFELWLVHRHGNCQWLGKIMENKILGNNELSKLLRHNAWWVRIRD